ncbi:MAG: DUF4433 domain-containing protein [Candidatus Hydrogenedentes bacterium]|nr:DUF4433 domain-containing protein [Candidatus Hydrogenedentota bacterium]
MPVPHKYAYRSAYHFTHIDNLPTILHQGALLAKNVESERGVTPLSVAYEDIQDNRAGMGVPCGPGGVVHDYAPFYFCTLSSMLLAVVNRKIADQCELIYLCVPITAMERYPCVFTNASANTKAPPQFFVDASQLSSIDWDCVDNYRWSLGDEVKNQRRMAELLFHRELPVAEVARVIVWNESIRDRVNAIYAQAGLSAPQIEFPPERQFYVTKFFSTDPLKRKHSTVIGPKGIREMWGQVEAMLKQRLATSRQLEAPWFPTMGDLRDALATNLGAIPETAPLVGLHTEGPFHSDDLASHTHRVLANLRAAVGFGNQPAEKRTVLELTACLHDIAKGIQDDVNRTPDGIKYKPDENHPVKGAAPVAELLLRRVQYLQVPEAVQLCKLVCYHDIVGGILNGRRIEELLIMADSLAEVQMLIAIADADIADVNPGWLWDPRKAAKLQQIRDRATAHFGAGQSGSGAQAMPRA